MPESASRLLIIAAVAFGAHLATVILRRISARILASRLHSETKAVTVAGFTTSVLVFAIYFAALGFALTEVGVSLATYFASASVIGLAVSFGSQGVVQDVINGLTVVFSDLIDVGDMVDLGGQVGIVERVGMRFTVLVNFSGARVFVPNRSIANVINYPKGYIRAFLDARVPKDTALHEKAKNIVREVSNAAHEQYPGVILLRPSHEGPLNTLGGPSFYRVKFRIWPGQGAVIENFVRQSVARALTAIDPEYADWMVTVHYRAEPSGDDPARRLPRPAALRDRRDPPDSAATSE